MARSSSLSAKAQKEIIERFFQVVGDLRTGNEARTFLMDFLTDSERTTFAKRLAVAVQLDAGKSYDEIQKKFGVSSATISSVAEMMVTDGLQLAIQKVKTEDWADQWAEKILKLLKK